MDPGVVLLYTHFGVVASYCVDLEYPWSQLKLLNVLLHGFNTDQPHH